MKHKIFSVYDEKAEAYLPPFFLHMQAMAARTFADCCNDKKHPWGQHPADYTLFQIGEFDDSKGLITPLLTPKSLGKGIEYLIATDQIDLVDELERTA